MLVDSCQLPLRISMFLLWITATSFSGPLWEMVIPFPSRSGGKHAAYS